MVLTSICKQIFKAYLSISIIHVKMHSIIMPATREEKCALLFVELGNEVSSFVMKEDTCLELNKNLRTSLIFQ